MLNVVVRYTFMSRAEKKAMHYSWTCLKKWQYWDWEVHLKTWFENWYSFNRDKQRSCHREIIQNKVFWSVLFSHNSSECKTILILQYLTYRVLKGSMDLFSLLHILVFLIFYQIEENLLQAFVYCLQAAKRQSYVWMVWKTQICQGESFSVCMAARNKCIKLNAERKGVVWTAELKFRHLLSKLLCITPAFKAYNYTLDHSILIR